MKYSIKYIVFVLVISVTVSGCNRDKLSQVLSEEMSSGEEANTTENYIDYSEEKLVPSSFMKWINEESSFKKSIEKNGLRYTLSYLPNEFFIIQELRSDKITQSQADSVSQLYNDLLYFKLTVTNLNGTGEFLKVDSPDGKTYEDRVKYYSFGWQKSMKMFVGKDSADCAMLHFERSFDINNHSTFLLAFPKTDKEKELVIGIRDSVFIKEKLNFKFTKGELNNLPQLKTI